MVTIDLPHEVTQVSRCDIALSRSVEALEGSIRLEGLGLAEILSAELYSLLGLTSMCQQFCQLFLRGN